MKQSTRFVRFCHAAALILFFCLMGILAFGALELTAVNVPTDNSMSQRVILMKDGLFKGLVMTSVLALAVMAVHLLVERLGGIRVSKVLGVLWIAAALVFVWADGLKAPTGVDSGMMIHASSLFARGDYSALQSNDYFDMCSYQLGFALPLEVLARIFPHADLNMVSQAVNVFLGAAVMGMTAALTQTLFGNRRAASASVLLYVLFLVPMFFCTFVYGALPMILCCICAFFFFARYVQTGKNRFGMLYALFVAAGLVVKPNTAVAAAALLICAVLHAIKTKKVKPVLFAGLSFVLGAVCLQAVIGFYEMRAGVSLQGDMGMTSRLVMGMQDSPIAAGWYNGYVENVFRADWTEEEAKAHVMADMAERLRWMRENPGQAALFYREKVFTQWLEPGCDAIWMNSVYETTGRFNGRMYRLFRDQTPLSVALYGYLNLFQQMLYALTIVGGIYAWKHRDDVTMLMLPVTVIGGILYHFLFEAKAQYAYPYIVYMLPLAAQGLCVMESVLRKAGGRILKKH